MQLIKESRFPLSWSDESQRNCSHIYPPDFYPQSVRNYIILRASSFLKNCTVNLSQVFPSFLTVCVMRFNLSLKYFITKHLTLLFLSTNFPTKNFLQISCKLSQFSLNLLNINKLAKQMKCWMFYKYQLNKAIKNYRRCLILIQIKQKRYKGNIQVGKS